MSAVNGAVGRDADKATLAKNCKAFDKLIFTECCEEFSWFLASGSDDFSKRLCKEGFMTMAKRNEDVDDISLPLWQHLLGKLSIETLKNALVALRPSSTALLRKRKYPSFY